LIHFYKRENPFLHWTRIFRLTMSYRSRLVVGPGDSSSLPVPDYNQEARNLWARLGIDPSDKPSPGPGRLGGRYNSLDVIFRSPQGGYIYVGDNQAASDLQLLRQNGISAVVNCTMDLPNYHTGQLKYYNFDVTWWKRQVGVFPSYGHELYTKGDHLRKLADFLQPMLQFIDMTISRGGSVLVHCLAGAHRAGTTGTICLLHFGGLSARQAEMTAKTLRPIIELIGDFPELLRLCDQLERDPDGRLKLSPDLIPRAANY